MFGPLIVVAVAAPAIRNGLNVFTMAASDSAEHCISESETQGAPQEGVCNNMHPNSSSAL